MVKKNRWLLPEGVEEILPRQAWQIEQYQRRVLDIYHSWGYELVIPPMIEYSDSLLIGTDSQMDLQTFKLTDQLSGRTLAVRADITPQVARMDAHSYQQEGATRLCYAGTVLHTRPRSQLASRQPLEVGAELYGDAGIHSDIEVISLMLTTLGAAGIKNRYLDLGHVGVYRALVESAGISMEAQQLLLEALDRKARAEVGAIVADEVKNGIWAAMLNALVDMHGDIGILEEARGVFASAPRVVLDAIRYLQAIATRIAADFPDVQLNIDLAELRGYQYHTGLVFSAYIDGVGHAVANGGRYDHIGEVFGRARPATGFSANVKDILSQAAQGEEPSLILAPCAGDGELAQAIARLRESGERVVQALADSARPANCSRELVRVNGTWEVRDVCNI